MEFFSDFFSILPLYFILMIFLFSNMAGLIRYKYPGEDNKLYSSYADITFVDALVLSNLCALYFTIIFYLRGINILPHSRFHSNKDPLFIVYLVIWFYLEKFIIGIMRKY